MGRQIIKIEKDLDLYMEYSSIVNAPTFIGTKEELLEHLLFDYKLDTPRYEFEKTQASDRIHDADIYGSSAYRPFGCYWDSAGEIYMQKGFLPRENFKKFASRYVDYWENDKDLDVSDLLEPFED